MLPLQCGESGWLFPDKHPTPPGLFAVSGCMHPEANRDQTPRMTLQSPSPPPPLPTTAVIPAANDCLTALQRQNTFIERYTPLNQR